jgi:hypothetical protein
MPNKMAGTLMLVAHMLGVRFIVPTTIKSVDVELFVYRVFGVRPKMQGIMPTFDLALSRNTDLVERI